MTVMEAMRQPASPQSMITPLIGLAMGGVMRSMRGPVDPPVNDADDTGSINRGVAPRLFGYREAWGDIPAFRLIVAAACPG
jgi:hypothetical protein